MTHLGIRNCLMVVTVNFYASSRFFELSNNEIVTPLKRIDFHLKMALPRCDR